MSNHQDRIQELNKQILGMVKEGKMGKELAFSLLKELSSRSESLQNHDIAIIGTSLRFPGANNLDEYWNLLEKGESSIRPFPPTRREDLSPLIPNVHDTEKDPFMKAGYLEEIDKFDADFFRIPHQEAVLMDPYQRLFLEVAYEAMEDAGYGGGSLDGSRTGVYVGADHTHKSNFSYMHMIKNPDFHAMIGSKTGIVASRISYLLNLNGPSLVIDTGCSSAAVVLHAASKALREKECDVAVAGGINLLMLPIKNGMFGSMEAEAGGGMVRPFDKDAKGGIWGEGVGVVLLKPLAKALADRDHIYAVIKGSAVNNNGASNEITALNAEAHKDLILTAWKDAKIKSDSISYIEAHGTSTLVGDALEVSGLNNSFRTETQDTHVCGIGTVKANVGHLVSCSGMASLFKVILAMHHDLIPSTLNFREPNPTINFRDSAVYVIDKPKPWEKSEQARRAGINSFSFTGTNCHLVIEEAPQPTQAEADDQPHVFVLSGKTKEALQRYVQRYQAYLAGGRHSDNLADICFTSGVGRGHYRYRVAIVAGSLQELKEKIDRLVAQGVEQEELPGISYGEHRIVPSAKRDKSRDEITEGEKRQLSRSINARVKEAVESQQDGADLLDAICTEYVKGADIDWKQLYAGRKTRRVSLPVYPLERTRYWLDIGKM
ncbi:MAG TPA: type I polyketide synthase [Bacilli bacterium]|nr:type I polyketide synthase [Bacilli bacterium]